MSDLLVENITEPLQHGADILAAAVEPDNRTARDIENAKSHFLLLDDCSFLVAHLLQGLDHGRGDRHAINQDGAISASLVFFGTLEVPYPVFDSDFGAFHIRAERILPSFYEGEAGR